MLGDQHRRSYLKPLSLNQRDSLTGYSIIRVLSIECVIESYVTAMEELYDFWQGERGEGDLYQNQ